MSDKNNSQAKVVLITGAARRIGAETARVLHARGMNIVIHYRKARTAAQALQIELNEIRKDSVIIVQADLSKPKGITPLIKQCVETFGRLDVLINNASSFYPTPMGTVTDDQWDDLMSSNLKAPFFLAQAASPILRKHKGCIVNIVDIHANRPLKEHPVYCMAKSGLVMMTKSLARELGPEIRVNAVAPGAIMWPENDLDELTKQRILSRTTLKREGSPNDIASTILFLISQSPYITGQIISVDGGRSLT
ncbi:FolM Alternative dihydrofolate reductase 1 [hydrothermal vent metagenome]|uniref:FolM Alternative dihydrofolate reductase 1 n=1 Tax=hydrothermal vent metagenome TaxID=652676 RepID=A0A3B1A1E8_9ZZZZ